MKFISLFAGIGGLDLGLERAGFECVAQVENDELALRILEMHWPNVPRFGDIYEVSCDELPDADLIVGGFPCQSFSLARADSGANPDGSLWGEMFRIIKGKWPRWILAENVVGIIYSYLDQVAFDLEGIGYQVGTFTLPASSFGAPHFRERTFIVACLDGEGMEVCEVGGGEYLYHRCGCSGGSDSDVADAGSIGFGVWSEEEIQGSAWKIHAFLSDIAECSPWMSEPEVGRVVDGFSGRMDELRPLGNAVVPQVAQFIGHLILLADSVYFGSRGGN